MKFSHPRMIFYSKQPLQAIICISLLFLSISCATQQPALQYEDAFNGVQSLILQKPVPPAQTVSFLQAPPGFEVKVFAAEPDIVNPIAFSWDERGRLWVLESTNYPHDHVGEESGTDRITICEDTNGDGRADKFTRFAENQPLSTAIANVKGGVLVGQAPHIVFMEDSDGDDRFDRKTPVLENAFGTFDTHAVMNNFKYGIDNQIWSAVGYSGLYEPGHAPPVMERTNEEYRILPMGVFRFPRDGSSVEPVGRFNNNTWGLGIGEDNTIFGSTANNNHAIVVGMPMRFGHDRNVANVQSHFIIEHSSTKALQQVDFRDGYTAAAGAFPYAGRRYPQKYWGALMLTEPTGHLVHTVYLEPDGAIFREKEGVIENLLASSDDWVAPVFADIGPDENVWIADWYNPVIQHNPDGRGMRNQIWSADRGEGNAHQNPLRDRTHGRIYIVEYTGAEGDDIETLSSDDPAALVRGLQSTNQFWRLTAQRLIVENRIDAVTSDLLELIEDQSVDELGLNTAAVHALWTLHGLGKIEQNLDTVKDALEHPSAAVRKAAIQVLPATSAGANALASSSVLSDDNLNTRLAAVLHVADMGDAASESLKTAAKSARNGGDEWIEAAVSLFDPAPPPPAEPAMTEKKKNGTPTAFLTINAEPDVMSFQQKELSVYEGQPITLVFNNFHPDLHNVVLLKKGVDVQQFGEALNAYMTNPGSIDTEYIPPSEAENVIASTGVLELGGSQTIEIDGLEPGEYVYICTVPGHWAVMQGVLRVEAKG